MEEFAAFSMPFIDGTSRFTTGQFIAYAGGWA
jgi:3-oxoacyl-[acyl-carrier protein] reductase